MKSKKALTIIISISLIVSVLTGCNKFRSTTTNPNKDSKTNESLAGGGIKLPLTDKPVTFKVFRMANGEETAMKENESWNKLSEKTGIYFEWINPIGPANAEQTFEMLIASQQLPDLIFNTVNFTYPGGVEKAVDDGAVIDLKDSLPKYAPNYWSKISANKEIMDEITTSKGYMPGIYQLQELYKDKPSLIMGMMLRGDWLEDLKLPVPKTINDWYITLKAFKENKKAAFPLLFADGYGVEQSFLSAFGIHAEPIGVNAQYQHFYPDSSGKIRYGGIEAGYQEYLKTMSKWYKEGLIDRDFMIRKYFDLPSRAKLMGNDSVGATAMYINWIDRFKAAAKDPNFKLVAAPFPVKTEGEIATIPVARSKYTTAPVSITSACKQPELLVKFFDYLCTEAGAFQANYGILGDTYTIENGIPKLTDKVLKNPLGASLALEIFSGNFQPLRLQYSENIAKQVYSEFNLKQRDIFYDSSSIIYLDYQLTAEESEKLNRVMGDILTYTSEQTLRAILDPSVAEKWMEVQTKHIKSMKIDEAIAIIQTAYDRHKNRK